MRRSLHLTQSLTWIRGSRTAGRMQTRRYVYSRRFIKMTIIPTSAHCRLAYTAIMTFSTRSSETVSATKQQRQKTKQNKNVCRHRDKKICSSFFGKSGWNVVCVPYTDVNGQTSTLAALRRQLLLIEHFSKCDRNDRMWARRRYRKKGRSLFQPVLSPWKARN